MPRASTACPPALELDVVLSAPSGPPQMLKSACEAGGEVEQRSDNSLTFSCSLPDKALSPYSVGVDDRCLVDTIAAHVAVKLSVELQKIQEVVRNTGETLLKEVKRLDKRMSCNRSLSPSMQGKSQARADSKARRESQKDIDREMQFMWNSTPRSDEICPLKTKPNHQAERQLERPPKPQIVVPCSTDKKIGIRSANFFTVDGDGSSSPSSRKKRPILRRKDSFESNRSAESNWQEDDRSKSPKRRERTLTTLETCIADNLINAIVTPKARSNISAERRGECSPRAERRDDSNSRLRRHSAASVDSGSSRRAHTAEEHAYTTDKKPEWKRARTWNVDSNNIESCDCMSALTAHDCMKKESGAVMPSSVIALDPLAIPSRGVKPIAMLESSSQDASPKHERSYNEDSTADVYDMPPLYILGQSPSICAHANASSSPEQKPTLKQTQAAGADTSGLTSTQSLEKSPFAGAELSVQVGPPNLSHTTTMSPDDSILAKLQELAKPSTSLATFRHLYEAQLAEECGPRVVSRCLSQDSGHSDSSHQDRLSIEETGKPHEQSDTDDQIPSLSASGHFACSLAAPLWLRITGVVPLRNARKQHATRLSPLTGFFLRNACFVLATSAVCFFVYELIDVVLDADDGDWRTERPLCDGRPCLQAWLLCDLTLALGALLGLFAVQKLRHRNILGAPESLLVSYASNQGLLERWWHLSRVELIATFVLWVCMVFERCRSVLANLGDDPIASIFTLHIPAFVFASGVLMAVAYCLLHVCCLLEAMIDSFGIGFVEDPEFSEAVRKWNILQAVLRRVSSTVDHAYLVVLTTALVAIMVPLMQVHRYAAIPAAFALLGAARVSYRAGAISYKCDRVPSLINSLSFGQDIDYERQYVVQYILNSMAGFYVCDVRITVEMVVKAAYVGAALTLAGVTRMISN